MDKGGAIFYQRMGHATKWNNCDLYRKRRIGIYERPLFWPFNRNIYGNSKIRIATGESSKESDGSNQWELSDLLNDLEAPEGIDLTENTIAEVLQLIANASCCVFYQDREGIIHINPLNKDLTDYRIDRDNSFANSEIELTKQLKSVNVNDGEFVLSVGNVGETQNVKNPLISKDRGEEVAIWTSEILSNRRIFSGEWRADPRLDAMDKITVENKFAESTVFVTQVEIYI